MKLCKEDVQKIAVLARVELRDEELEKYGEQLSSILEYVGKLQEVDTLSVGPDLYITDLVNAWQEDENKGCTETERELILGNMPDKEGEQLRTIGVFKK